MLKAKGRTSAALWMALLLAGCGSLATQASPTENRGATPRVPTSTRAWDTRTVSPASPTVRPSSAPTDAGPIVPGAVIGVENARSLSKLGNVPSPEGAHRFRDLDWAPNGGYLAIVVDEEAQIFEVPSLAHAATIRVEEDGFPLSIRSLDFNRDGSLLLVGGMGFAQQWDWRGAVRRQLPDRLGTESFDVEYSPDGLWIGAGSPDGVFVRAADGSDAPRILREESYTYFTRWIGFSPDGRTLVAVVDDGMLRAWEVDGWLPAWERELWAGGAADISFSPDGLLLATGGSGDLLPIVWVDTGEDKMSLPFLAMNGVAATAFSPNGQILALGTAEGRIVLSDLVTLETLVDLKGQSDAIQLIEFSPDGRLLAAMSSEESVALWGVPAVP